MVMDTVLDNETLRPEISREKIDHRYSYEGPFIFLIFFLVCADVKVCR